MQSQCPSCSVCCCFVLLLWLLLCCCCCFVLLLWLLLCLLLLLLLLWSRCRVSRSVFQKTRRQTLKCFPTRAVDSSTRTGTSLFPLGIIACNCSYKLPKRSAFAQNERRCGFISFNHCMHSRNGSSSAARTLYNFICSLPYMKARMLKN